jgi:predicted methyltransferase
VFVEAGARNLPAYIPKGMSYVLLANIFHGIPEKAAIARAVHEVLRPRGSFGLVNRHAIPKEQTQVLDKPQGPATEMRLSPEQTRAIVEPTGFEPKRVVELLPYHYGVIFTKN